MLGDGGGGGGARVRRRRALRRARDRGGGVGGAAERGGRRRAAGPQLHAQSLHQNRQRALGVQLLKCDAVSAAEDEAHGIDEEVAPPPPVAALAGGLAHTRENETGGVTHGGSPHPAAPAAAAAPPPLPRLPRLGYRLEQERLRRIVQLQPAKETDPGEPPRLAAKGRRLARVGRRRLAPDGGAAAGGGDVGGAVIGGGRRGGAATGDAKESAAWAPSSEFAPRSASAAAPRRSVDGRRATSGEIWEPWTVRSSNSAA